MTRIAHVSALPLQLRKLPSARSLLQARTRLGLLLLAFGALFCLAACATGPRTVTHSFTCDKWRDGWADQADLLAYSYGDQVPVLSEKQPWPGHESVGCGTAWIAMPVADFLYVKWRLKATGEVIEDRVDLRGRLPSDMFMHQVTFVIDGRQLHVYVITPTEIKERLAERPQRTWLSRYNVTYEIYPNNQLK